MELGSDQTSLHNPFGGGYYPVQLSFEEANDSMENDSDRFRELVQKRCMTFFVSHILIILCFFFRTHSLVRQVRAINKLAEAGLHFWDYGNAFLLEASRAGSLMHALTVYRCVDSLSTPRE